MATVIFFAFALTRCPALQVKFSRVSFVSLNGREGAILSCPFQGTPLLATAAFVLERLL